MTPAQTGTDFSRAPLQHYFWPDTSLGAWETAAASRARPGTAPNSFIFERVEDAKLAFGPYTWIADHLNQGRRVAVHLINGRASWTVQGFWSGRARVTRVVPPSPPTIDPALVRLMEALLHTSEATL